MTVTFSYHPCRHLLSIPLPYRVCMFHMYQCEGDRLYHFLHFRNYPKYDTLFYYSIYFLTPSFFPFGALQTDRRTEKILHPLLPKFFFFPLSARGPTRRRNTTGLAELWGGWPIELVYQVNYVVLPTKKKRSFHHWKLALNL